MQGSVKVEQQAGREELSCDQVEWIVRQTAQWAGIALPVSPHWLMHAQISHSLDRLTTIGLVADTVDHSNIAATGFYTHARPKASSSQFLPI